MRVFLDANVHFSAAHSPLGRSRALFRLAEAEHCHLFASEHAILEARRNLAVKSKNGQAALVALLSMVEVVPEADPRIVAWAARQGLPANDAPILAAAVTAGVDLLVTGDRRHFGHLFATEVAGIHVVALAQALDEVLK